MLLQVERMLPGVFDRLPFSDLAPWLPDQAGHCSPLGSLRRAEVRQKFGMSPLLVGCWACLAAAIKDEAELKALIASPDEPLWQAVDQYELSKGQGDVDIFPPGPAVIWQRRKR
eukprot:5806505-Lingulodinium_polyedra.AAC.1